MDIITEILLEGYDIIEIQKNLHKKVQLERLLNGYWLSENKASYLTEVASGLFNEWNQIVQYKEKIDDKICTDDFTKYYKYFFRKKVQGSYVVSYRILSVDKSNEHAYLFEFEYCNVEDGFVNVLQWESALPYGKTIDYINTYGIKNNVKIETIVSDIEDFEFEYGGILYL